MQNFFTRDFILQFKGLLLNQFNFVVEICSTVWKCSCWPECWFKNYFSGLYLLFCEGKQYRILGIPSSMSRKVKNLKIIAWKILMLWECSPGLQAKIFTDVVNKTYYEKRQVMQIFCFPFLKKVDGFLKKEMPIKF